VTCYPFVSVVIPTYNRAHGVTAALASVLAQTYLNFEVIVVDDGSTDGTAEALQEFICGQHCQGKEVRYFFQPNGGQSAARNRGIAEARGKWIAFLDSDDVWLPRKLEWQVRATEHFVSCGACITDAMLTNLSNGDNTAFRVSGKRCEEAMGIDSGATKNLAKSFDPYWVSTLLARAAVVRQIGGFDSNVEFAEDHDFNFRLSLATSFCYVNEPLAVIDRGISPPGSTCRPWDNVEVRLRGQQSMFEKWLKLDVRLPPDVRQTVVRNLQRVHSGWTNRHLEQARYQEAKQAVSRAMKCGPTSKLAVKWMLTWIAPAVARRISPKSKAH